MFVEETRRVERAESMGRIWVAEDVRLKTMFAEAAVRRVEGEERARREIVFERVVM